MYDVFDRRLQHLTRATVAETLRGRRIGLEKECLRVHPRGGIAESPHPEALGSALTHPYITTDFSEALLEFITPPYEDLDEALVFLDDLHRFVYRRIGEEFLWATSMPCVLAGERSIPLAQYGTSNRGRMKHVYRRGLGYRYSRVMQVIAGVHFNYSLPEPFWAELREIIGGPSDLAAFTSGCYFALIRNLQRVGWLVPYLFGASPAVCKSFFADQPDAASEFEEFDDDTAYLPYATSIRVSDIGYQNRKERTCGLDISYNSLEQYLDCLRWAVATSSPEYEQIGLLVDGEYRQLNTNVLQIENEYYSSVRPKQPAAADEPPLWALTKRGVSYVELRSVDVCAFDPIGVNAPQLRFLEAFMIFCLLHESPPLGPEEREEIDYNLHEAACRGRDPSLALRRRGTQQRLRAWAQEICERMAGVCELLDRTSHGAPYGEALAVQQEAVRDPGRTPSARMIDAMARAEQGFSTFALQESQAHRRHFMATPPSADRQRLLEHLARESMDRQRAIEAADELPFEEYLRRYFAAAQQLV